jgi:hypothetical protein
MVVRWLLVVATALTACWTSSGPPPQQPPIEPAAPQDADPRDDTPASLERAGRTTQPLTPRPRCSPGAPSMKIAVLGLESRVGPSGVIDPATLDVAKRLTAFLRTCAEPMPGTEKELVDEKLMNNCSSQAVRCMAAVGKNYGVDHPVFGSVTPQGSVFHVDVLLLDVLQPTQQRWTHRRRAESAGACRTHRAIRELA